MAATATFQPTPTLSAHASLNLKSFLTSTRLHHLRPRLKNSDRLSTPITNLARVSTHLLTQLVRTAWGEETMGRIYDALKRAESAPRQPKPSVNRNGNPDN